MPSGIARVSRLILEVPSTVKLGYCLFRDERVPAGPKATLAAALALIASPLDIPAWIPIVGDLDMLALAVFALKIFIDACPEEVVEEHRAAIKAGDSIFDRDLRAALAALRFRASLAWERLRSRARDVRRRPVVVSPEDVPA